jgi:LacI family transcriptional regulator
MRTRSADRVLIEQTDTDGLDATVKESALRTLQRHPGINSVYSIGGGNQAILEAFDAADRRCNTTAFPAASAGASLCITSSAG